MSLLERIQQLHDEAHEKQDKELHELARLLMDIFDLGHISIDELDEQPDDLWHKFPLAVSVAKQAVLQIGSSVKRTDYHDIDLLVRSEGAWELLDAVSGKLEQVLGAPIHLVHDESGPHGDYVPVYDVVLIRRPERQLIHPDGVVRPGEFVRIGPWRRVGTFKFPVVAQHLIRGERYQIHKIGEKIVVFNNEGEVVEDNPSVSNFALAFWRMDEPQVAIWEGVWDGENFWICELLYHEDAQAWNMPLQHRLALMQKYDYPEPVKVVPYEIILTPDDLLELEEGTYVIKWRYERIDLQRPFWFVYEAQAIKPGQFFKLLKPGASYHGREFFSIDEIWEFWAKRFIEEGHKIYCQAKIDGTHCEGHVWAGGEQVRIFTEDRARDRSQYLGQLVKAMKQWCEDADVDSIVFDGEIVWYKNGKVIPRKDMAAIWGGKRDLSNEDIRWFIFDLVYVDGEDIHEQPYQERFKRLKELFSKASAEVKKRLILIPNRVADSKETFYKHWNWASSFSFSEGMVCKLDTMTYELDGGTVYMAKCKTRKEIHTLVIGRRKIAGKDNTYQYRCALKAPGGYQAIEAERKVTDKDLETENEWEMAPGWPRREKGEYAYGSTYAVEMERPAKLGEIISVMVDNINVWEGDDGKEHISWEKPRVMNIQPEEKEPDSVEFAKKLAKYGTRKAEEVEPAPADSDEQATVGEIVEVTDKEIPPEKGKDDEGGEGGDDDVLSRFWFEIDGQEVEQDDEPNKFCYQHHVRGIMMPDTVKRVQKILLQGGEEAEKVWKEFGLATLTIPVEELKQKVRAAKPGEVSSIINQALDKKFPGEIEVADLKRIVQRGNCHGDLRIEAPPKREFLLGITQAVVGSALQFMDDPKHIEELGEEKFIEGAEQWPAALKYFQPYGWLTLVDWGEYEWSPPGDVGATKNTAAVFYLVDKGQAILGVQKHDFHEVFLIFERNKKLSGRYIWTKVNLQGQWTWLGRRPKDQTPYILTHNKEKEEEKAKQERGWIVWNPLACEALAKTKLKDLLPVNWEDKVEPFFDEPRVDFS